VGQQLVLGMRRLDGWLWRWEGTLLGVCSILVEAGVRAGNGKGGLQIRVDAASHSFF